MASVGPAVHGHSTPLTRTFYEQKAAVGYAVAERGAEAGTAAFIDWILDGTIRQESAGRLFEQVALECSWWTLVNDSPRKALSPAVASAALEQLHVPTVVITAEYDFEACREIGDLIVASVPDVRQTVMSGTGHLMHIERPGECNALLTDLLRAEI